MPNKKSTVFAARAAATALFMLGANAMFAQAQQGQPEAPKGTPITVGEIVLYVAIILGLMVFAWWLATREKKVEDKHHASVSRQHHGQIHHHHSNDPYFKRAQHKR